MCCYGERHRPHIFLLMDSAERRKIDCLSEWQQAGSLGSEPRPRQEGVRGMILSIFRSGQRIKQFYASVLCETTTAKAQDLQINKVATYASGPEPPPRSASSTVALVPTVFFLPLLPMLRVRKGNRTSAFAWIVSARLFTADDFGLNRGMSTLIPNARAEVPSLDGYMLAFIISGPRRGCCIWIGSCLHTSPSPRAGPLYPEMAPF